VFLENEAARVDQAEMDSREKWEKSELVFKVNLVFLDRLVM
jgi:hypothetical protein